ncbi:MAG: OmpA family protein [Rhodospirillaceae bacterium]|jgi:outer membrane protein OmpA-like peptidoglycan-associated protein|nr:OmpA family protein [Rhodospirillaceae bacterium]MBT5457574.1 OmpA family protein [Rhodospirillaceae bacterium]
MADIHRHLTRLVFLAACLFAGQSELSAQTAPSATLKMSSESAGIFVGWHDGTGTLTLKDGSQYDVTMDAYSLPSIGYSRSDVTGEIYNLENPADFAGEYFTTGQSSAFRDGKGEAIFTNDKNVRIELVSKETGLRAGLNFGSATFKLGKRTKGPRKRSLAKAATTTPVAVTQLPAMKTPLPKKPVLKKPVVAKAAPVGKKPVKKAAVEGTAIKPVRYTMTFGFNKTKINQTMARTLDTVIKNWKNNSAVFHIVGHADLAGGRKYNIALSQIRANAVKQALQKRGIPAAQIVAVGVGYTAPAVSTQKGLRLRANRRVVLTVLAPE